MPSKYVPKKPRTQVPEPTSEDRMRKAMARTAEIRETKFRLATAELDGLLRGNSRLEIIKILCCYMQLDKVEMMVTDLREKRNQAYGMATKNRAL